MGRVPQVAWRSVDGVVREAIHQNIHSTNLSFNSYTARVMEHYARTVPAEQRSVEINDTGDAYESLKRFSNKLSRCISIDGDTHLPAVLVPALIACLDEPWQHDCRTAVLNLIFPERLQEPGKDAHPLDQLASLAQEHSEAVQAYLAVARDGFDNDSEAALMHAFNQLQQARDVMQNMMAMLDSELQKRRTVLKAVK